MDAPREPLVAPDDVAEYVGVSSKTLAQWRYLGSGPRFVKAGRCVRYRWSDVEAWLAARSLENTAPLRGAAL